jgi:UDP-perosamine 4-acetyltransferase
MKVIVLGAGGHAKVVIELLRASGHEVAGLVGPDAPTELLGAPRLGDDDDLPALFAAKAAEGAFIAVGENRLRCKLAAMTKKIGFTPVNAISPNAIISPSAKIGAGVALMAGAVVNADAVIGDCAIVNTNAGIDHDCVLDEGAHVAAGATLAGTVRLGKRVLIGAGAVVAPGVTIADDAIIGAGACVVRDIREAGTYVGVPARVRQA